MEEDAYAIRAIASAGMPMLVSNSFSKIFSLYGERVGGLSWSVKTPKPQAACWGS
jgi:aromatic-amino-acid transaminase